MANITVPGSSSTFTFTDPDGIAVAQQIAAALVAASVASNLSVTTVTGGAPIPLAPTTGQVNELVVAGAVSGAQTVPAGYGYIIDTATGAETITGGSGIAVMGGSAGLTFFDSGIATVAAAGGTNFISVGGAGSNLIAGGTGADSIIADGGGTISGGLGSNFIRTATSVGSSALIKSSGADQIFLGAGSATVAVASVASINAVGGSAVVSQGSGSNVTMFGGSGTTTVFGGAGSALSYFSSMGIGSMTFVAGSGSETVNGAGSSQSMVMFGGTGNDLLIGGSGADTIIAGSSASTISGGAGADLFEVLASNGGAAASAVITDFSASDTLLINGYGASAAQITNNINAAGGNSFLLTDGTTITLVGTTIAAAKSNIQVVACFLAGTRIGGAADDLAVDDLRVGDCVVSAFGGTAEIIWIGYRQVDARSHPRPEDVWPVRIAASAFGAGLPSRDLFLSPDHSVYVDGVLIPVRYLINGATITQVEMAAPLYFHIELRQHDVILAEGLACESYLDTGNRAAFANADVTMLHPDFATPDAALAVWQSEACAELVVAGPILIARKQALRRQAEAIGYMLRDDPQLCIYVDGVPLDVRHRDGIWEIQLPRGARAVRLQSRAFVPAQVIDDSTDTRSLGVAIANISLDGVDVTLDDPRLFTGWQPHEPTARWTNGDAGLVVAGARVLRLSVALAGRYWVASPRAARLRA